MTGIILDTLLMLLLVAAIGYGLRLERKLTALREGQLAFAGAVTELNTAAARAESALASLRSSGQETDLLHDRIVKGRQLKAELEGLIARRRPTDELHDAAPVEPPAGAAVERRTAPAPMREARPAPSRPMAADTAREPEVPAARVAAKVQSNLERIAPMLEALAANQAAKLSLNRARRTMDEDLFAA